MRPMKNWKVERSRSATRREPYQKTSAMTQNERTCVIAYVKLEYTAALLDRRYGASKDSR